MTNASGAPTSSGSSDDRRTRRMLQYAGIFVVAVAYLGGIAGWTYASMNVEPEAPEEGANDTAALYTFAPDCTTTAATRLTL